MCLVTTSSWPPTSAPARLITEIENTLKLQLIISTVLATPVRCHHQHSRVLAACRSTCACLPNLRLLSCLPWQRDRARRLQVVYFVTMYSLPSTFVGIFSGEPERIVKNWYLFVCVASGLWGGLIIGLVTEYFTSNRYAPVQVLPQPSTFVAKLSQQTFASC